MHVVFVTPAYPPFPGGGERYVRALAFNLAQRGHQVTAVTSTAQLEKDFWQGREPHSWQLEQDGPITVIRCPLAAMPGGRAGLLLWRKLMIVLSALPGDQTAVLQKMARYIPPIQQLDAALAALPDDVQIVHGFNLSWENALMSGWFLARRRHIPFVLTPFAHFGTDSRDRLARNATMDHQRRLLASADAVLALTSVEIDGLREWQIQPRRTAVIGGGLDPLPEMREPTAVLEHYGLQTGPFALFIGRVSRDKGALDAVRATLALNGAETDLTLVLVGQSSAEFERDYASLTAAEQKRIRPLGILDEQEKHALLATCTMLLLPSHTDSFGIVFLEAWAHGRPVIGARAGGIPGVVDDGENGLLVPYGDVEALAAAMRRLLTEPELGQTMGQRGRQKVQEVFNWDHVGARVLQIYEQVLAPPQP
ncbi:MAG: glycosyltransferase family 4 protein [Ardenticatenaceae bacterium]|nr:glycosyltransferase family 4 protein [Ardenticatenaceae bacterium]